jgi:uncharacterized membrane protein
MKTFDNGFEIVDRYDIVINLLIGLVAVGVLALGAPLWVAALIVIVGWTGIFIRHFDDINGPKA